MKSRKNMPESFESLPFKDLKKILREKRKKKAAPAGENTISEEELFKTAMREVREIREFRGMPVYKKNIAITERRRHSDEDALRVLEMTVNGKQPIDLSGTQEYVEWTNKECGEYIIDLLHSGQFSVQDTLDLHGSTLEEAEKEVDIFIKTSLNKSYRCIKIIHGRGLRSKQGPVLKKAAVHWLSRRYSKYLLAFVTARQCDGGLGALYVLLK